MTRQNMWLKISRAYATPFKDRDNEQIFIAHAGLCYAIDHFLLRDVSPKIVKKARMFFKAEFGNYKYWFPTYGDKNFKRKYDNIRSLFACFMATMPENDYENFIVDLKTQKK